ncbi:MAG: hypothetical protein IJ189_03740 [Clostridia bacterium]|nr:hypothetical protein [Clostridia bacterium]
MQAVRRNMQYSTTGVHSIGNGVMHVRSQVRLPDADAGRNREEERQAYIHDGPVPSSKKTLTLPRGVAAFFLIVLSLYFVAQIGVRLNKRSSESKQISSMEQAIAHTIQENKDLTVQIAECRDSSRICYKAVQELGMMSSAAVEAVPVIAPDTRPYEVKTVSAAENSPSAAGIITGSR